MPLTGPPQAPHIGKSQDAAVEGAPTPQMAITKAATLKELAKDYAFFSHAALLSWTGAGFDPVQQFVNEYKGDANIAHMTFELRVFQGVAGPHPSFAAMDRTVFLTPHAVWPELRDHLAMVGLVDRNKKAVYRAHYADVYIADPVRAQVTGIISPAPEDAVSCCLFGVRSNKFYLRVVQGPLGTVPGLVREEPSPEDILYANATLADKNPFLEKLLQ